MSPSKSKRPNSAARHGSSFIRKLHQRHDAHHHIEQEPLIQPEEEIQSSPEPETVIRQRNQDKYAPVRDFFRRVKDAARRFAGAVGQKSKSVVFTIRNNPKRSLASLAILTTAISIGETIEVVRVHNKLYQPRVCSTPECIHAADMILRNMDPLVAVSSSMITSALQVDPCNDFNRYACGGFENQYMPDHRDMISSTTLVSDAISNEIHHILESKNSNSVHEVSLSDEAWKAFSACKNMTAIQEIGLEPLKLITENVSKHFEPNHVALRRTLSIPMMTDLSFTPSILYAMEMGLSPFMSITPSPQQEYIVVNPVMPQILAQVKNSDKMASYKIIAEQTLKHVIKSPEHNSSLSLHLWNRNGESLFSDVVDKMVQLELSLHDIAQKHPAVKLPSATPTIISIEDADGKLEKVSFKAIADNLTHSKAKLIIIPSEDYLENLAKLMRTLSKDVAHMYLVWSLVKQYADHIESEYLLPWKNFAERIDHDNGDFYRNRQIPRGKVCVSYLNGNLQKTRLGWVFSKLWLQDFEMKNKAAVVRAVNTIKAEYQHSLEQYPSAEAIEQRLNVLFVDKSALPDIDKMYEDLKLGPIHFENMLSLARWEYKWYKTNERMPPPSLVETHYSSLKTEVQIPAAILRRPFSYEQSVPAYLLYGSIGSILAHQMTHAFGSSNATQQYNSSGPILPPLWSNKTRDQLIEKENCFKKQYADLGVSGDGVVEQAIADAQGVRVSFEAWKKSTKREELPKLPGLEQFTSEQLFWLAFANKECSKFSHSSHSDYDMDPTLHHVPGFARIKGAVANNAGFLDAFKCSRKEPICTWF